MEASKLLAVRTNEKALQDAEVLEIEENEIAVLQAEKDVLAKEKDL